MSFFLTQRIVLEWRTNVNELLLIFTQTSTGALSASLNYPFPCRGKSCFFIKRCRASLDDFIDDSGGVGGDESDDSDGGDGNKATFQSVCVPFVPIEM